MFIYLTRKYNIVYNIPLIIYQKYLENHSQYRIHYNQNLINGSLSKFALEL